MLTAVGLAFGDMADAVVVGQKMGAVGLAAVSLVLPVFMVINIFVTRLWNWRLGPLFQICRTGTRAGGRCLF